ncbi:UNVERIFIED_ORG: hypothetical protein GGR78_003778 [Xanthomonas campestris]
MDGFTACPGSGEGTAPSTNAALLPPHNVLTQNVVGLGWDRAAWVRSRLLVNDCIAWRRDCRPSPYSIYAEFTRRLLQVHSDFTQPGKTLRGLAERFRRGRSRCIP